MPRVASEVTPIPSPRPSGNLRRADHAPGHPFDLLLDPGNPAPEPKPARQRPAPERANQASTRSDTSPTRGRRAEDATRPEQPGQSEHKHKHDAVTDKNADQATDAANPKDTAAQGETAPATDEPQEADTTEAGTLTTLIDATQPATQQPDNPSPILAAPAPATEVVPGSSKPVSETAALTPAAGTQTPAAAAAATNAPASGSDAATADAQGAIAQQAAPKIKPGKTDSDGKSKPSAQPVHGKNDAAAAKDGTTPQNLPHETNAATSKAETGLRTLPHESDAAADVRQNPQDDSDAANAVRPHPEHAAKPQGDQPPSRHADPKQLALPPDASQRARDALEAAKPAADPAPNFNPSAPGATVAANHAAAASALARADTPAIPLSGLAVEIVARAQAGRNRFEIRLDPPELGRIDVRLDVDRHGAVTSRLVVERAETLDLLRRDAAQLERALQDAGLKTADNSLQFMLRDQSFGREQQQAETGVTRIVLPDADPATAEAAPQPYGRWPGLGGGIDIRV